MISSSCTASSLGLLIPFNRLSGLCNKQIHTILREVDTDIFKLIAAKRVYDNNKVNKKSEVLIMSTIAMVVDKSKEAHYKDYVNFLGNYKNKKHNESDNNSVGYSLSSSTNSSCSEISEMPVKSFNEYLQDYTHKKFQPVQPKLNGKDTILSTKSKNIKTELVIQVNNGDTEKEHIVKNFGKLSIPNEKSQSKHFQQIQKKFNLKPETEIHVPLTIIRLNSLESNNVNKHDPFVHNIHKSSINNQYRSNAASESKSNQEKIVENIPKKVITALNVNESFLSRQKSHPKNLISQENDNLPKKIVTSNIYIATSTPPTNEVSPAISPSSKEVQRVISANKIDEIISPSMVPPPPPPLPTPELRSLSPISISKTPYTSKPQSHTLPRMMSNGQKIQKDTVDASTINRNDPRMKKAVYGALRNMYGAYHEKANDYLATLPKNRVKKGNGLDSIIDSIAAQGGLEKLCGRAKVEAD